MTTVIRQLTDVRLRAGFSVAAETWSHRTLLSEDRKLTLE
jgi:hypothetical protein